MTGSSRRGEDEHACEDIEKRGKGDGVHARRGWQSKEKVREGKRKGRRKR